jgi:hypothetical protein
MNGRCVYCDHGEACHPGTGTTYNLPLATGRREEPWMEQQDLARFGALIDCACYGHQWAPVKVGDDVVCRRCGYRRSEVDDNGVPKIKYHERAGGMIEEIVLYLKWRLYRWRVRRQGYAAASYEYWRVFRSRGRAK